MDLYETFYVGNTWAQEEVIKCAEITGSYSSKFEVRVLLPVQQPGSYWDRSSELPLVGLEPTEVTAYD